MTLFLILVSTLILVLFVVPVRIGGIADLSDERPTFTLWVRLMGWVLGVNIEYADTLSWRLIVGPFSVLRKRIGGEKEAVEGDDEPEKKKEKKDGKTSEQSLMERLTAALTLYERFSDPVLRLLRNLLRSVWFRHVNVEGTIGMGVPDATGRMMGYVYAASGALGRRVSLDIQPDFLEPGFSGRVRFEVWFWPGFLILAIVYAALTIGIRYAVWYLQEKLAGPRRAKPQTA